MEINLIITIALDRYFTMWEYIFNTSTIIIPNCILFQLFSIYFLWIICVFSGFNIIQYFIFFYHIYYYLILFLSDFALLLKCVYENFKLV